MLVWLILIPFWYLCIIIAGSINTIIYRISLPKHLKLKLSFDDCFCEYCGKQIRPKRWANLPLINYILLNGTTNCCNQPINILHPISEFSLGTLIFLIIWTV